MAQDFLADCEYYFINIHSCYTTVAFILVNVALVLITV